MDRPNVRAQEKPRRPARAASNQGGRDESTWRMRCARLAPRLRTRTPGCRWVRARALASSPPRAPARSPVRPSPWLARRSGVSSSSRPTCWRPSTSRTTCSTTYAARARMRRPARARAARRPHRRLDHRRLDRQRHARPAAAAHDARPAHAATPDAGGARGGGRVGRTPRARGAVHANEGDACARVRVACVRTCALYRVVPR